MNKQYPLECEKTFQGVLLWLVPYWTESLR